MALKILFFDYRKDEHDFFDTHSFPNYDIKFFDYSLNEDTVKKLSDEDKDGAYIVSVFIDSFLSCKVINSFKNLRIISTRSTGFDHINKKACVERNINVINVAGYGQTAVGEFTFGLILNLLRKICQADFDIKTGDYKNKTYSGTDLSGLTLGVIGTGATGAYVCNLARAFGVKLLAYDVNEKRELASKCGVKYTTFENLLMNSDIVSLHLPFTGDNYHMFSEREVGLMKEGSYFINVARGELVDNMYLKRMLESGKLKGAALDVIACQNVCSSCKEFSDALEVSSLSCFEDSLVVKELKMMPNVILTPHIAYESKNAVNTILKLTFDGIRDCINGGSQERVI